ncbi:protein phosphatase 1 regulatory subunit 15B [Hyperolius riggenbachi]|uniref:protein phosphatase 1 regulatory subunit 15B n=1 Tax=Hyperolius riggenbachi TaxID=752182 RepID=UPI0035A34EC4
MMCADRDRTSQPGLRALLGRLLHGLFPYRLLQLLGAAWSYITGQWSLLSLPSGWVVHRSVRSAGELPEMLEVLRLRPWEEPGECCLDELEAWKELLSPAMESDLDVLGSWKGFSAGTGGDDALDSALEGLSSWQKAVLNTKVQAFWGQGLTCKHVGNPNEEEAEIHKTTFTSHTLSSADHKLANEDETCQVPYEKNGSQLPSALGIMSCILNVGSSQVLSWVDQQNEQNKEAFVDITSQTPDEIQHIRNKRLWFLQQNQAQENMDSDIKEEGSEMKQEKVDMQTFPDLYSSPNHLTADLMSEWPEFEWEESQILETCNNCDSLSDINFTQLQGVHIEESQCAHLQVPVQEVGSSDGLLLNCPSTPDKDQGYHSLEDWQCVTLAQSLHIETCDADKHVLSELPTEHLAPCSFAEEEDDQPDEVDFDINSEIPFSSIPVCTNRHIGYILGTVVSDDENEDENSSDRDEQWDKEENDDGFDSEGSVSTTDSEVTVPDEVSLWNSFCSSDPYNPQNFTASLKTGGVTEEDPLPVQRQEQSLSDEESWCDSDVAPSSDSEEESSDDDDDEDSSANEEENQKLWNAFLKSDDPYNPLYFKAPVQTLDKSRICNDSASSNYSEVVCRNFPNKLVLTSCPSEEPQQSWFRDTHNVPVEDRANTGQKKVIFHEKITIHYVCSEEQRKGCWEELARDRCRFERRIKETESTIGHCMTPDHRQRVWERMTRQLDS